MARKQKLEHTWIGKENRPKLGPRILPDDAEKSFHTPHQVPEHDVFDNRLIFRGSQLGLHALEHRYNEKRQPVFNAQDPLERHRYNCFARIEGMLPHPILLDRPVHNCWRIRPGQQTREVQ